MPNLVQQIPPVPPTPPVAPVTAQTGAELRVELRELAGELKQVGRERRDLARRLEQTTGAEAVQLNRQIAELDARSRSLEAQITDRAERMARTELEGFTRIATTVPPFAARPFGVSPSAVNDVFVIACVAIIGVLAVAVARRLWRTPQRVASPADGALVPSARLDRLEHAIEAMAIEIERIAEGQRFVTKLLTERGAPRVLDSETPASRRA